MAECITLGQFLATVLGTALVALVVYWCYTTITLPPGQLVPPKEEVVWMVLDVAFGMVVGGLFFYGVLVTPIHRLAGLLPLCKTF